MPDEMDILRIVVARLDAATIHYMLSGSLALGFYATPRMTRDIDLVVELPGDGDARIEDLFGADFYVSREMVREAIDHRRMFNVIHLDSATKVDFVVRRDEPFRIEEFRRRRRVEILGFAVWIVTAEDLVLSKLVWAILGDSEMQRRDVRSMLESVDDLDQIYLDRWAPVLGVAELLAQLRQP